MTNEDDQRVWTQLIAAVGYVAEVDRPGFTIGDAIDEALRHWISARFVATGIGADRIGNVPWNDPDPLRTTVERLLDTVPPAGATDGIELSEVLSAAVEAWTGLQADAINDGHAFATIQSMVVPSRSTS